MDLYRGWTRDDVERIYESASSDERVVLETLARRMMATREDFAQAGGPSANVKTVDGLWDTWPSEPRSKR